MPSSEIYNPAIIPPQLLPGNYALDVTDKDIKQSLVLYIPEIDPPVKMETALTSIKIFAIKFKYLTRIFHTKVMKVKYASSNALYKVVLCSTLNAASSIWWIEHLPYGWVNLLGNDIDECLKEAITNAIEYQELP